MHGKAALHRQGKSLLMLFILLVAQLHASGDWQASGSFEPGQYEAIRVAIDDAFDQGLTGTEFACNISTTLNNQFDRFWNVVSGKVRDLQYDAVLFGFSHNWHWFWINNYRDNKFVIVWKDYNCGTEFSRSFGDTSATLPEDKSGNDIYAWSDGPTNFGNYAATSNIWAGLYSTIRGLETRSLIQNTLSGVAAFGGFSELGVCICHLTGGDWVLQSYSNFQPGAQLFAFETRAGKTPLAPLPS